ncbi:DNA repair protein RecN (Recombination protein N) [Bacillus mesophilus]|uniref:DNA repair protein RecN n=1 Tax=Bacillus mesophilus TaxID=1808955 RepID=A0A6M0Q721_9BACI|nr:DNA repair protein RecN [Bacillus mesophilus]MBM7660905.1 DNA repair protein RecN (Recombination protein N) [Bacillus mesophilus]NEY71549.1 DNA repair protein RecN [Bacillus mesophilus]
MLAELSIRNFAIIEELTVSFQKGLTVLTGETGAGKSIIIDAIGLLVGGRGSAEFVRFGMDKAEIEGLFLIDDDEHPCYEKTRELGIEVSEGNFVLRRYILKNGKSVCRVNGKLVTLGILREIGQTLLDIHGQHEHQLLMDQEHHITLLDQYGEESIIPAVEEYQALYKTYQQLHQQLKNLTENEQQLVHRLDLLQFQLQEISSAELEPGEDERLFEEKMKISNFEKIFQSVNNAYHALHGDQKGLDWIGLAMNQLETISNIDSTYKELFDTLSSSFYQLEDLAYTLRDQLDGLEYDPNRLNSIETRLNEINQLKRKYGQNVEEILKYAAKIEDEIDEIVNRDSHINKVKRELENITKDIVLEAETISEYRKTCALSLEQAILTELKELFMEKANFKINFSKKTGNHGDVEFNGENIKLHKSGFDVVEFYISPNPGEPLKPLTKVASGGELSRIMLALKSIFSKHQGVTSIIFDEVDTGVSGRVAQAIAEKIHRVSVESQVLCISHLPQVAAMADQHLFIEKETTNNERTKTSIKKLNNNEQVKEVARMISGVEITELTIQHAKELLTLATQSKANAI